MGEEKLDNTVYYVRGLYDLADMAAAKRDRATERWARGLADRLAARFDSTWWDAPNRQYADSLGERQRAHPAAALDRPDADGGRADRRRRRRPRPGAARPRHGRARRARDTVLQRRAALQPRPVPHRLQQAVRAASASGRSSRSTPRSRPSGSATTGATRAATPGRIPHRCSSPTRCRARCRRSCPRPNSERQHRPLLDLPRDVRAGLGPLRHGVAGRAPAARRAAVAGHRRARGRAAAAAGPDAHRRALDPARHGRARRARRAVRPALRDDGPRGPQASTTCASARRCRAGRRSTRSRSTGGASSGRSCARPTAASRSRSRPTAAAATRWWSS